MTDRPVPATAQEKLDDFRRRRDAARLGGSEKSREKHLAQGKMLVRERLKLLFDAGVSFEDGLLAGAERNLPGDAVVCVYGKVHGRDVAVIANDMTVKAGTWGYQTFLKITRTQQVAAEAGIPIVYLVDSAGARIDEQKACYLHRTAWGNIFRNQVLYSGVVPQLCLMFGPSPAGSAYVPALCDLTIMVDQKATAYLGSPRLAEAAIGEKVTEEEMGGAKMHCQVSGLGDMLVKTDEEAIARGRDYLGFFPANWQEMPPLLDSRMPASDKPIAEIVPADQNRAFDMHKVIDSLVDGGSWFPVKHLFAREIVTGLARLGGRPIGIIANNSLHKGGVLFNDSSDKAARFIWQCNAFNIPLLFLQDISGYMIGSAVEKAGIIRHGAKLLSAVCESTVPRIAVMVRKAYGGGFLAMSGAPTAPDAAIALPTAMPALMGPEAAINAVYLNQINALAEPEREEFIREKRAEYAKDIDVYAAAADPFAIEAVVEPADLRDELIARFALYARRGSNKVIARRSAVHPV